MRYRVVGFVGRQRVGRSHQQLERRRAGKLWSFAESPIAAVSALHQVARRKRDRRFAGQLIGLIVGIHQRRDELRIRRFAAAYAPLDEALARAVVDISGRSYLHYGVEVSRPLIGDFQSDLVEEFFRAFVTNASLNLHLDLVRGKNAHHEVEAVFKATALALREAVRREESLAGVLSTKGTLSEEEATRGS